MLWYRRLTVTGRAPHRASGAAVQVNNLVWWDIMPGIEIGRPESWMLRDVFGEWLVTVDVNA